MPSEPASQLKKGRKADQKDRVVFALSAIIGGIVAYQFPQKRTLLSMRGISVISHNTIIIFLKPLSALLGEKKMVMITTRTTTTRCPTAPHIAAVARAAEHLCSYAP